MTLIKWFIQVLRTFSGFVERPELVEAFATVPASQAAPQVIADTEGIPVAPAAFTPTDATQTRIKTDQEIRDILDNLFCPQCKGKDPICRLEKGIEIIEITFDQLARRVESEKRTAVHSVKVALQLLKEKDKA